MNVVFGFGGGKITKKIFLAILIAFSVILISLSSISAADLTAPTIKSIDPVKNAVNVPADKTIKVTFSEAIKTGTGWIELLDSKGNTIPVTTSISGSVLTIKPSNSLIKRTKYTVVIHTGSVTDLAGNNVKGYVSYFTADSVSPTVTSVDPVKNAVNVPANKVIKVTFSEAIKTGTGWIELLDSKGNAVPVTTSLNGTRLTVIPNCNLTKGTKYTIVIHTGSVTDLAGNNVAGYTSYFTVDSTQPAIKGIDPLNNAVNIPANKAIKVTFSEAVKTGTGWIELLASNGTAISITKLISGNVLTITPDINLIKGITYSLLIHTGSITDLSGNNVASYVSRFTVETTPPTIKSIDPSKSATNVPVNKVIKITFSEAVKMGSGWIELKDSSGNAVSFTTSINNNILTITPDNNLTKGTKYNLNLHTGSVTDLAGNNLAVCGSTFTTNGAIYGVWLPSANVLYNDKLVNVTALIKTGITDIFVKVDQTNYNSVLNKILSITSGTGIKIHAWITCFFDSSKPEGQRWIDPKNSTYTNSLISFISTLTTNYDIDGIHLDYVRYSGVESSGNAAYQHENGTETITSFVQNVYNTVKLINLNAAVSAALMPEGSVNAKYYGQDYSQLANYLDFLVPMIYKGNYGYNSSTGTNKNGQSGADWIASKMAYIVSQAHGTPVIAGLQTYRSDIDITKIPASELQNDINAAINNGSSGYVLFRYGLIDENFMDI